jgi:hypothetical protein
MDDEEQEVVQMLTDDPDFPSLTNSTLGPCNRRMQNKGKQTVIADCNVSAAGALAPMPPHSDGHIPICKHAPPIYAAVVTSQVVSDQLCNNNKAHHAQQVQACGPLGRMKPGVTVSPCPQPEQTTGEKLSALRKYAHDFRHRHTTDAEYVSDNSDDEDYNLAIRRLVVT